MLYDFLLLDRNGSKPLYQQLYEAIRRAVEQGQLEPGERVPSIRRLSEDLHLSRTTVENAYQQLCVEGYLHNKPQSGYFIKEARRAAGERGQKPLAVPPAAQNEAPILYRFDSGYIDAANADIKNWSRCLKDVLRQTGDLASYGDPQGERRLRRALAQYSHGARGVAAPEDAIVIGAGIQPLLYLLCSLMPQRKQIALEEPGFLQAQQVFADCGVQTPVLPADQDGVDPAALESCGAKVLFVSPSNRQKNGAAIPVSRRVQLLHWAERCGGLIIEDDYNGELRYRARPIPAMQGMQAHNSVVYLGSFSKLLLPSVRMAYMILPEQLLQTYRGRMKGYHQTASKIEQLALARYVEEGHLERHLRRLRKLYAAKSSLLEELLRQAFGGDISCSLRETALILQADFSPSLPAAKGDLPGLAARCGVRVMPGDGARQVWLSFAGIPLEDIPKAVPLLQKAWGNNCGA